MSAKSNKKNAKRAPQQVLTRRVFPAKPAAVNSVAPIDGSAGKTDMHQTESTVDHPMGKTHHGVRQSHER